MVKQEGNEAVQSKAEKLGKWSLIDIETSGIDPAYDKIIDVGFLQFEGTQLVRTYSSLVKQDVELSQFIQKLTGISPSMLKKAPLWEEVEPEVMELEGHHLLAHNSSFEKMFLETYFETHDHSGGDNRESYEDSIPFLALLHPGRSSMNLEGFIIDYGIADKEIHRGYEDSVDLLKVLLLSVYGIKKDAALNFLYKDVLHKHLPADYWYLKFFDLEEEDLIDIANQIEFDLESHFIKFHEERIDKEIEDSQNVLSPPLDFSGENIEHIFKDENEIKIVYENYKFRPAQLELSKKVGQSFKNNIHSLIQAPTGTGKTLGYLVPSALFSKATGERVLVATGTKALQAQAVEKDIPQLRKLLGLDETQLKVTHLVGSSNHYCELMFRNQLEEDGDLLGNLSPLGKSIAKAYFELVFQLNDGNDYDLKLTRLNTPYILKSFFSEFSEMDQEIAVDYRACTGGKCPYKNSCSYIGGLREASESNIILGNHALMLTWPRGLDKPSHIVVDEAHKIEKEATHMFSYVATQKMLENFTKGLMAYQGLGALFYLLGFEEKGDDKIAHLRKFATENSEILNEHQSELPLMIESHFKKRTRYSSMYWNERPFPSKDDLNDSLVTSILNRMSSLQFVYETLYEKFYPFLSRYDVKDFENDQKVVAYTRFESFMANLEDIVNALNSCVKNTEGYCHSLRFHERDGYEVLSSPIDSGKVIFKEVLDPASSVVFTSATLANAKGDMGTTGVEWLTGYLFLDSKKRFKTGMYLPASFDYKNKTRVHICSDVPSMHSPNFVESILNQVNPLIKELGGKSLLLFSSRVRFEIAREILLREFEGKIPVFSQGMGNNVVEEFKKAERGILIGMESFGEGIDVPGEKLQFLFIDKIPDIRMDLVIQQRRNFYESTFGNEFNDYFLANRTRSLHQKLGRLLRRENDIGAAIIVDSRIAKWKSRTLGTFKSFMEPYDIHFSKLDDAKADVSSFLQNMPS